MKHTSHKRPKVHFRKCLFWVFPHQEIQALFINVFSEICGVLSVNQVRFKQILLISRDNKATWGQSIVPLTCSSSSKVTEFTHISQEKSYNLVVKVAQFLKKGNMHFTAMMKSHDLSNLKKKALDWFYSSRGLKPMMEEGRHDNRNN